MAGKGSKPGERRGGRKAGTPNKLTATVKEAFETTFRQLQGVPGAKLDDWAKSNTTEFYKISSKLIPSEVTATVKTQESAIELLKRGLAGQK